VRSPLYRPQGQVKVNELCLFIQQVGDVFDLPEMRPFVVGQPPGFEEYSSTL
jgi:hypothetical protein